MSLSVASTVVLLQALEQRNALDSAEGHIAMGWLIVEDLVMVLVLVILPVIAKPGVAGVSPAAVAVAVAVLLGKIAIFGVLAVFVGTRFVPWLLMQVTHTGSRELFTLAVLAIALGIAYGSAAAFGVSLALGAFFAGVVLSESELSQRAAADSLPLKDAFALSPRHGADDISESCPDRRVLIHSGGTCGLARASTRAGTRPDPGWRYTVDRSESTRIHEHPAARALAGSARVARIARRRAGRIRWLEASPFERPAAKSRGDRRVLEIARRLNPHIHTTVRTHSDAEQERLQHKGVGLVVLGERELGVTMANYTLTCFGRPASLRQPASAPPSDTES